MNGEVFVEMGLGPLGRVLMTMTALWMKTVGGIVSITIRSRGVEKTRPIYVAIERG